MIPEIRVVELVTKHFEDNEEMTYFDYIQILLKVAKEGHSKKEI